MDSIVYMHYTNLLCTIKHTYTLVIVLCKCVWRLKGKGTAVQEGNASSKYTGGTSNYI